MIHIEIENTCTDVADLLRRLADKYQTNHGGIDLPRFADDADPVYDRDGNRVGRIWSSLIEPCKKRRTTP